MCWDSRVVRVARANLLLTAALIGVGAAHAESVRLRVESPVAHSVVRAPEPMVRVRGTAQVAADALPRLDLMLVLDTSRSTRLPSGADVDGDGVLGAADAAGASSDREDDVLHAEVAAARALVAALPRRRVRVGVVTFSGASDRRTGFPLRPDQRNARLVAPLTADRTAVEAALGRVLEEGAHGATDFSAGIRTAVEAFDEAATGARAIVFLTDGLPSFPAGRADVSDPGDREAALEAAREAGLRGVRIHAFALGVDALSEPGAAVGIARESGGSYTGLRVPGDVVAALGALEFTGTAELAIHNLTTGAAAVNVALQPDGRFEADLPVRAGANRLRVEAGPPRVHLEVPFTFRPRGGSKRSLRIEVEEPEGSAPTE